ncbi:MAG: PEP-CTERM sorting domain-containing protein [Candidatus Competibacteraceae bacterium]|nr:PEP-CTERM sorting domain-containing protein [Candidatus Competibacteraceae bacterium]MCB1819951.1 PEP-CTERM sorting domain-containing protein [Candidatus Competibacteraceae bacterium]
MKTIITTVLLAGALAFSATAHAITIGITPSTTTLAVGDTFSADVIVSDLGNFVPPSLGVFDLNIAFTQTTFGFTGVNFGSFLGDLGLGEATSSVDDSTTPGVINLFELSFLEADGATCLLCIPPYLDDIQPASFVLATLAFDVIGAGVSALTLSVNSLGDGFGDPLDFVVEDGSPIIVRSNNPIPEPATVPLLAFGIALLGLGRVQKTVYLLLCG